MSVGLGPLTWLIRCSFTFLYYFCSFPNARVQNSHITLIHISHITRIVVNGAVHWLVKKLADGGQVIISFLLAEEKVEEIELPPNASDRILAGAFRNSLCLTSFLESETYNEFWVMKEYGVRESLSKIKSPKPFKELSHSGFWTETHDLMASDGSSLVMCNFRDGTSWNLPIGDLGEDCSFGSVGVYVECLPSKVETSVSNRGLWRGRREKPCKHNRRHLYGSSLPAYE